MAAGSKFNNFVQYLANGTYNLGADTLKCILTNTAPIATNSLYGDISANELANGNGYTTGGVTVTGVTSLQTSGTLKLIGSLANPTWTATGAMGPFQYAVLYDSTPASPLKPLICAWNYGSTVSLVSGQTFTVALDTVNGILQIT
jgi:hypothetical protein